MSATNRQKLRRAITRSGLPLAASSDDLSRHAIELSSRFPQSGLTIDVIEEELRAAALERSGEEPAGEVTG
jgi:hypothetical protein